jgi:CheY-like chemotaxis protein
MSSMPARAPSSLHVLVVEDEAIICEALCMNLEHLGVGKVTTAPNGRKALRQLSLSADHPDLVLLDIYMPEMDGIEFLNALLPSNYTGAVALMSGVNIEMLDLSVRMAKDLGFRVVGACEKPVSLEALEAFLQQA